MRRRSLVSLAVFAALAAAAPTHAQENAPEEPETIAAEEAKAATAVVSAAAEAKAIHAFDGGTGSPGSGGLAFDKEGNLYGVAQDGGDCEGCGVVYMLSPPADGGSTWEFRELHRFGGGADGAGPKGTLTVRGNAIYGVTSAGGDANCDCGTVFRLKPIDRARTRWDYSVLYRFPARTTGASPAAGLVFGEDGGLYGSTAAGGAGDAGTIFKLRGGGDAEWRRVVLHHFSAPRDGGAPGGELVVGPNRTLFGTTSSGGRFGAGTVFRLTRNGSYAVLHHFRGADGPGSGSDGASPAGGLVMGEDGALYGATGEGGEAGLGTIFRLKPTSRGKWLYTIVHHFAGGDDDGARPRSGLAADEAGNVYGATSAGGPNDGGVVFRLKREAGGWGVEILKAFGAEEGAEAGSPASRVAVSDGVLYGAVSAGTECEEGCGAVYRLGP
jgi:uncharacterized repeat protein (TIGR03803 family)